jgi:mRNA-degrading endonuclease toxin of MazEF toxin-antitoxin module
MVLLLSWDTEYNFRDRLVVAPISSHIRGLDAEVFLDHNDGMQHGCAVNLDVLTTILRVKLTRRVTQLSDVKMFAVERAIHHALGMELPCRLG